MTTRKKFIASFGWQAVNVFSQVALQLVFISVLARLISKDAFGVMGIALVAVGFIEIFSQIGIGPALIQRKNLTQEHINGAFFISTILGILFTVGLYFVAPLIAGFYEHEPLTEVLRWIGLSFFISAMAIVPKSMIIKEMSFKKLFFCSGIAMTIGNLGVGLTLAFMGYDIWAYIFALLSQNLLMTITYWIFHPVKIGMSWNWETTREMIRYGGGSTLFNMFNYAATKIDVLVVGKFEQPAGTDSGISRWARTGVYERSAYLMGLPITVLGKLSDSVMFSGLSQLQDQKEKLKRAFLSAVYHIGLLVVPGSLFMIFFVEEITVLFLGEKYLDAVPIVQILFSSVALRSLIKINDSVVRALDRVYTASAIKALFFFMVGFGAYYGYEFGLKGVAWALVASVFVQYLFMTRLSVRLVGVSGKLVFKKLTPAILISVIVLVSSIVARLICGTFEELRLIKLIIGIIINGIGLLLVAWFVPWIFRQGKDNVLDTIARRIPLNKVRDRWLDNT